MAPSPTPEQIELFNQLEHACWNNKMYTINPNTANPDILPIEIQLICENIRAQNAQLPIDKLLDMSEYEKHPDYYPQRYVVGYYEIMQLAIDYIQDLNIAVQE
jgi:hypothetical protein